MEHHKAQLNIDRLGNRHRVEHHKARLNITAHWTIQQSGAAVLSCKLLLNISRKVRNPLDATQSLVEQARRGAYKNPKVYKLK